MTSHSALHRLSSVLLLMLLPLLCAALKAADVALAAAESSLPADADNAAASGKAGSVDEAEALERLRADPLFAYMKDFRNVRKVHKQGVDLLQKLKGAQRTRAVRVAVEGVMLALTRWRPELADIPLSSTPDDVSARLSKNTSLVKAAGEVWESSFFLCELGNKFLLTVRQEVHLNTTTEELARWGLAFSSLSPIINSADKKSLRTAKSRLDLIDREAIANRRAETQRLREERLMEDQLKKAEHLAMQRQREAAREEHQSNMRAKREAALEQQKARAMAERKRRETEKKVRDMQRERSQRAAQGRPGQRPAAPTAKGAKEKRPPPSAAALAAAAAEAAAATRAGRSGGGRVTPAETAPDAASSGGDDGAPKHTEL